MKIAIQPFAYKEVERTYCSTSDQQFKKCSMNLRKSQSLALWSSAVQGTRESLNSIMFRPYVEVFPPNTAQCSTPTVGDIAPIGVNGGNDFRESEAFSAKRCGCRLGDLVEIREGNQSDLILMLGELAE